MVKPKNDENVKAEIVLDEQLSSGSITNKNLRREINAEREKLFGYTLWHDKYCN